MCHGLAVIVEKIGNEWVVYAKQGESSHDALLHELRDDFRYGKAPHLKFEVVFPSQIRDDIQQDVGYPPGWTYIQWGKKTACREAFFAVSKHIYDHPELLEFTPKMLSKADLRWATLREADLSGATLSGADLSKADLSKADLRWANLSGATLSGATLSGADLRGADLREADLRWATLREADLSGATLSKANLSGAKYSKNTIFPQNFDPKENNMILEE